MRSLIFPSSLLLILTPVGAFLSSSGMPVLQSASFAASFRLALAKQTPRKSFVTSRTMSASSVAEKVDTSTAYATLASKLKTITQLQRAKSVLSYDQLVFMPQAASPERGAQLSALAELIHEKETDPSLLDLMNQAQEETLSSDEARLLELSKRDFEQNARVSPELAGRFAALQSSAYTTWVDARTKDDFDLFASTLQDCFDTAKEVATAKRGDKDITVYTQMLDEFEMGMSPEVRQWHYA